ncbi:transcription termination factor Rho [Candidatus Karelsulcia muelleri]|uniref:transcription termination factor Rho n=1 Tax=Candidatus Karelsulcia muelleri TaxID=336810 RepID=UPI001EF6AE49|nr:transcription termination factor Rho [Candidatus Karelsulcia muelleri]
MFDITEKKSNKYKKKTNKIYPFKYEGIVVSEGVLETMTDKYGFLRSSYTNYFSSYKDVSVSQSQIRLFRMKTGDTIRGEVRTPNQGDPNQGDPNQGDPNQGDPNQGDPNQGDPNQGDPNQGDPNQGDPNQGDPNQGDPNQGDPNQGEKSFPLKRIFQINGRFTTSVIKRKSFKKLTPLFPNEKFKISKIKVTISTRIVDLFSPLGKGQRGIIVAPPKTGKTTLLKEIANTIAYNHPEVYLIILLIDERPEEVTDMQRNVNGEVVYSTFDEPAEKHVKVANIVLQKAKRMVECGHDVVILLDSITRLARAYNTVSPTSGKILSGGVDSNALQKPKRFFGAARNIEYGGSLSIIATAIIETGSKMDEVIFEEFKGTGNMELQLDRKIANKRIFPAIDLNASSTRKEEFLLTKYNLNKMFIIRKLLAEMTSVEAIDFIKTRLIKTKNNKEFFKSIKSIKSSKDSLDRN